MENKEDVPALEKSQQLGQCSSSIGEQKSSNMVPSDGMLSCMEWIES